MTAEEAEAKRQRVLRARELIEGAGWVFDEYVAKLRKDWLNSAETDEPGRERIFTKTRVALEMKAELASIINNAQNDEVLHEHRNRDS